MYINIQSLCHGTVTVLENGLVSSAVSPWELYTLTLPHS